MKKIFIALIIFTMIIGCSFKATQDQEGNISPQIEITLTTEQIGEMLDIINSRTRDAQRFITYKIDENTNIIIDRNCKDKITDVY